MNNSDSLTFDESFDLNNYLKEVNHVASSNAISILPTVYRLSEDTSHVVFTDESKTFRKELLGKGLPVEELPVSASYISENDFNWLGPLILVPFQLLSENKSIISILVEQISAYLSTYYFLGKRGKKTAKFSLIIEKKKGKSFKKIDFDGPVEDIQKLSEIIDKMDR